MPLCSYRPLASSRLLFSFHPSCRRPGAGDSPVFSKQQAAAAVLYEAARAILSRLLGCHSCDFTQHNLDADTVGSVALGLPSGLTSGQPPVVEIGLPS
jgi:hypothetical protein